MILNRRKFLHSAIGAAASLSSAIPAWSRAGRLAGYGAAVSAVDLDSDPALGPAMAAICDRVTPVSEMKWAALRPKPDVFAFHEADAIVDFATSNHLGVRGHTLVWYAAMPDWTSELDTPARAEKALVGHIETVMSRYRDRVRSWDVVNEPIPDVADSDRALRPSLWQNQLGERHIDLAFRTAAAVDPTAQLTLNEYDIEYGDENFPAKRAAFRALILRLLDRGVPLGAIGLQCHMRGAKPIDRDGLYRFVDEMHRAGLEILVTELDMVDNELPGTVEARDAFTARHADQLLETITAAAPLRTLATWGFSDRHSWISYVFPRKDGQPSRPLPFDSDYRPKPLMAVIEKYLNAAPGPRKG